MFVYVVVIFSCKENIAQSNKEIERHENECLPINEGDFYSGKKCIKEKELLSCVRLLNDIKKKGIASFFFKKIWFEDKIFMKYMILNSGEIRIFSLGPEKNETYKKRGRIYLSKDQFFFFTPEEGINNKEIRFPIKKIDCELDNSNFAKKGTFVKFTLSDGEDYQYGVSPKGDPLIGYKNSENLFKPEVLSNPEVWHKASLILSE